MAPLLGIGGGLVLLVAGLDALFGWSPDFSLPAKIVSMVIILAGYLLGSYALLENRFFSGTVRIQTERGHQVVSSGPLPLDAAPRLRRGAVDLPGNAFVSGFTS